ncbi:MAG: Xaa-Pro peptidase family protein [Acidimicrobiales bacterium]|nr:Xaa-Pro peptidase family protein [Acidimicrobiales bacterium]
MPILPAMDSLTTDTFSIDHEALIHFRRDRLRAQMVSHGVDACLLFDPINMRYATGARNMQIFHQRNPSRYLFLPVEGPVVLFEFTGGHHLAIGLSTIDKVRPATTVSYVAAGPNIAEVEKKWADEVGALLFEVVGAGATVGLERINHGASTTLAAAGFRIVDAQGPVERARSIKGPDELTCIRQSLRATESAVHALRDAIRPGITENQLWSELHRVVIAEGGDYVETRLLTAGTNTNPWFQETGDSLIAPNALVALDTDVVGCHGYYSDFSRTFHAGPDAPHPEQKRLYGLAHEQVHHNMGIIGPGVTFREYAEHAWEIPDEFTPQRYYLSSHGVGMTGEYPYLYHRNDFESSGYDGVIEPGMTICVEAYIGATGGAEGVKLEEQVLVTETGTALLSQFPFELDLLGSSG